MKKANISVGTLLILTVVVKYNKHFACHNNRWSRLKFSTADKVHYYFPERCNSIFTAR